MPQPQNPSAAQLAQEVMGMLELRSSTAGPRVLRVCRIAAGRGRGAQDRGQAAAVDSLDLEVAPEPVGLDDKLHAAIDGRRIVSEDTGGGRRRVLIPLAAADEVRYVVEI